jgi:hypothetical protein
MSKKMRQSGLGVPVLATRRIIRDGAYIYTQSQECSKVVEQINSEDYTAIGNGFKKKRCMHLSPFLTLFRVLPLGDIGGIVRHAFSFETPIYFPPCRPPRSRGYYCWFSFSFVPHYHRWRGSFIPLPGFLPRIFLKNSKLKLPFILQVLLSYIHHIFPQTEAHWPQPKPFPHENCNAFKFQDG